MINIVINYRKCEIIILVAAYKKLTENTQERTYSSEEEITELFEVVEWVIFI